MSHVQICTIGGGQKPVTLEDLREAQRKFRELEEKYKPETEFGVKLDKVRRMGKPHLSVGLGFPSESADLIVGKFAKLGICLNWSRNPFTPKNEIWFWDKQAYECAPSASRRA